MEAFGVVVAVDEGEDFVLGIGGVDEAAVCGISVFERGHEGLGSGVVRVGACGHALAHFGKPQDLAEGPAAGLAATVAVEGQIGGVASGGDVLLHGFDNESLRR